MAPGELNIALGGLDCSDERVLVGMDSSDDAAVFRIDDTKALVQTVDIITPVVDDPYVYGQIAAANSLSDIFAMGAEVATAMNVVGFDGCNHPKEVLNEILEGGQSKVKECGGVVVGGHTIETPEMLYGLSVSGFVHPDKIYRNNTPRVGDVLILTKPLGMGILTTAIKADMLSSESVQKIAFILAQLNYKASEIMKKYDVSACTDVTGFGLLGHALEMSENNVEIEFDFNSIPFLEEAKEMADMGIIPAGTYNNMSYVKDKVLFKREFEDEILLFDAQTSGGLLIAVKEKDAQRLLNELKDTGYDYSSIVAQVVKKEKKSLVVK